jgi:hypothetical protein
LRVLEHEDPCLAIDGSQDDGASFRRRHWA